MQKATALSAAETLKSFAVTKGAAKAALSKQGFGAEEIDKVLDIVFPEAEKRRTFRTVFEEQAILALTDGKTSDKEGYEVFDKVVDSYYPKGSKDPKASNTLKHRDYYVARCFGFGRALLEAAS